MKVITYRLFKEETNQPYLVPDMEGEMEYDDIQLNPAMIAYLMNEWYDLGKLAEEYVYLICFNQAMHITGIFELSHGTVSKAIVSPREIMIRALLTGSTGIIIVHNHPSGSIKPSAEDISIATTMEKACNLMDIKLHDFLIIGGEEYLSLCEKEII